MNLLTTTPHYFNKYIKRRVLFVCVCVCACARTRVRVNVHTCGNTEAMSAFLPYSRQMHTPLTIKVTSLLTKNDQISQTKLFSSWKLPYNWQNCFKWRNISQNIDKFKFTWSWRVTRSYTRTIHMYVHEHKLQFSTVILVWFLYMLKLLFMILWIWIYLCFVRYFSTWNNFANCQQKTILFDWSDNFWSRGW